MGPEATHLPGALHRRVERALGAPRRDARPARRPLGAAPPAGGAGPAPHGLARRRAVTRSGVAVDVWSSAGGADVRRPLVLWLPALMRDRGYDVRPAGGPALHLALARDGATVACHDPIGTGSRIEAYARDAGRHPGWSPLGRMVHDAREVVTAATRAIPGAGPSRPVHVVGMGAGALVALHLAVLDARVASVAVAAPASLATPGLLAPDAVDPLDYDLEDLVEELRPRPALVAGDTEDATDALRAFVHERAAAARRPAPVAV